MEVLCSRKAELGANQLLERLKQGRMVIDVLPNSYPVYPGEMESADYVSFCGFIRSKNGKKVADLVEEEDGQFISKL